MKISAGVRGVGCLVFALAAGCGSSGSTAGAPDGGAGSDGAPAVDPHALVTSCDAAWNPGPPAPAKCEAACAIRPTDPAQPCTSAAPCNDLKLSCKNATHPRFPSQNCPYGFALADGTIGCCIKPVTSGVPTFYACAK